MGRAGIQLEVDVHVLPSIDWSFCARVGSGSRLRPVGRSAAFRLPAGCTVLVAEDQVRMLSRAATMARLHFATWPVALLLFVGAQLLLSSGQSIGQVAAAVAMSVASAVMLVAYPVVGLWLRRLGMPYLKGDTVVLPDFDTALAEDVARRHPGHVRVLRRATGPSRPDPPPEHP